MSGGTRRLPKYTRHKPTGQAGVYLNRRRVHFGRYGSPESDLSPLSHLFDDSRCEVTLMSGLPASGKDTWGRPLCGDQPVISLDDLHAEFGVAPDESQGTIAQAARERSRVLLRRGESSAWNATSISRMLRRQLVDLIVEFHARVNIVYVETSPARQRLRNRHRENPLPEAILNRLRQKLEVPDATEATLVSYLTT